ncbi:HAMP domain-containing sensor histidine kinase [Maridesulfovibrio sp.]|uniref:HAMP domain-containing sensor histidine kinase n=1 Tax=Maridesulfovibrio sp. TaxID=2795000 RepID=UPI002A1873EC|nr:HAMP domain-containing sensor histidine kinase [Maridesulfovibrio sp.]
MRLRLFWKILFSFWLTFICIVEGVWIIFSLNDFHHPQPWEMEIERSVAETVLSSAATVLQDKGEAGLAEMLRDHPGKDRFRLSYELIPADVPVPPPPMEKTPRMHAEEPFQQGPVYSRMETLPDGSHIRLNFNSAALMPRPNPGPLSFPLELPILGLLGGLLFSSLLAWYLTAPVWRLKMGFEKLASGILDIRLKEMMGKRRDEIADLARDFDQMAERMQILVESREQLLHDVSHELRSPLARLHMAVGLARQIPERTPALLDRIEQESARMDDLVGELLTLSRVESGGTMEDYFDLQELTRVVVNNSGFEAEQAGISLTMNLTDEDESGEGTTIKGDAELVRRAIENVLRNAIRHSPEGSSVNASVVIDQNKTSCSIEISDNGPGVPEGKLAHIFEPFIRLNSKGRGSGLGLAIAKRAIAAHGGTIRARNNMPSGLTITISLPLEPPEK